jgi:rubrerythrin
MTEQGKRRAIPLSPLEQPPDLGTFRLERETPRAYFPRLELRCSRCGHHAITTKPIRCPVCGGEAWDFVAWRPSRR